jgi:hypothetical protein
MWKAVETCRKRIRRPVLAMEIRRRSTRATSKVAARSVSQTSRLRPVRATPARATKPPSPVEEAVVGPRFSKETRPPWRRPVRRPARVSPGRSVTTSSTGGSTSCCGPKTAAVASTAATQDRPRAVDGARAAAASARPDQGSRGGDPLRYNHRW